MPGLFADCTSLLHILTRSRNQVRHFGWRRRRTRHLRQGLVSRFCCPKDFLWAHGMGPSFFIRILSTGSCCGVACYGDLMLSYRFRIRGPYWGIIGSTLHARCWSHDGCPYHVHPHQMRVNERLLLRLPPYLKEQTNRKIYKPFTKSSQNPKNAWTINSSEGHLMLKVI